jgi:hypothetical protein
LHLVESPLVQEMLLTTQDSQIADNMI